MFSIGDFARHGRVSVRMLRHYDAIGLLRPARVDQASGYRFYRADQLALLNRIIALKDLGFTLEQVRSILSEQVGTEQLRGMLTLRRAQLAAEMAADSARLAQVEARLLTIESEGRMPANDIVLKPIPAIRVAELSALAASFTPDDISPVVQPLCRELGERVATAGVVPSGHLTCYYEKVAEDSGIDTVIVHAAVPISAVTGDTNGLTIVDLPGAETAATTVHRGSMDAVLPAWQAIARWTESNGYSASGFPRELYIEVGEDTSTWVTELQEPVTRE